MPFGRCFESVLTRMIFMWKKFLKIIIYICYGALIVSALMFFRKFGVQQLLNYTPSNIFLAVLFMLALFALKSISVFFPIMALQIACGFLFSPMIALLVSTAGTAVAYTIPFFIGRFTGAQVVEDKISKKPELLRLFQKQHNHEFFLSFFLRVISCLPADLISLYLGALKFRFRGYLVASVLGTLPGLIPAVFIGDSIRDPLSPQFIISLLITIISALLSVVIYYFYNKKNRC